MSVQNLLSTNTVNFQDLVGNGKSYIVPPYQRDYSWTVEEWEDLWLDIQEVGKDANGRHYMGAVVVKAESDRSFLIIDGQQRIATLTILGLAIIKWLEVRADAFDEKNRERAKALRNRFIGEKDPASLTEIGKLTLNTHDNGFFQDYLVQLRSPGNPRSLPRSNRQLWDCFCYFEKKIGELSEFVSDGELLAQLLSETVARKLLFIQITVADEISAYTVFETLNARGLELTTTDLLKNYLFSKLSAPSDLEAVQRRWHKLVTTVRQDRFGEFLRYHYLTRHRKVRSARLFKMVRDEVRTAGQVLGLLESLEARAELFDALGDAGHSLWVDRDGTKEYIEELVLFRVRQVTPLLFVAFEKLSNIEFVKVLKLVVTISFRYTVISGLNTNDLEPAFHDAAKAIIDGAVSASEVFEKLRGIYVSDEKFETDFAQATLATSGQRRRIAKYILCRLEEDAGQKQCHFETDPGTIEHILPENPGESWELTFSSDQYDACTYRLGNLTLLRASSNRVVGNAEYAIKAAEYARSEYAITRQVPDMAPEEWTQPRLEARQKHLAARAKHVWRSDFT